MTPSPVPTATPVPTPSPSPTPLTAAAIDGALPATPAPSTVYEAKAPDATIAAANAPTPFPPSASLSNLGTTTLVNTDADERVAQTQQYARSRQSVAPAGDHEAWGFFANLNAAIPYDAFYAIETGYEFSQAPFPYPSGVTGLEQTFAPTIHNPGYGCLEDSTYYRNDGNADQSAHFTVFNFCLAQRAYIFDAQITKAFVTSYEARLPNGQQSYVVETFTPDANPSPSSTWYTILFNFATGRWDKIISVNAGGYSTPQSGGWNFAETYFQKGNCPKLAPSGSSVVGYYNSSTKSWLAQENSLPNGLSFSGPEGSTSATCFLPSGSSPATLRFELENSAYNWVVTSAP